MASKTIPYTATANAAGAAIVQFTPPSGYEWTINHIGISSNSTAACTCIVSQNGAEVCGSSTGTGDAADGGPMQVKDGDSVTIVWSGCSVGAVCTATIIIDENLKGHG